MSRPLAPILRSRINRLAHRRAAEFELRERDKLTERLQQLAQTGADFNELAAALERVERERTDAV